jgi:prepilin-type processing-associated H-X9-DG protein
MALPRVRPDSVASPEQVLPGYPTTPDGSTQDIRQRMPVNLRTCIVLSLLAIPVGLAVFCIIAPVCSLINRSAVMTATMNNMRRIGQACVVYHDTHKTLPTPKMLLPNGNQAVELTWRVSILPFLDEQARFAQFDLTRGWDSAGNAAQARSMPDMFDDALRGSVRPSTYFQYFTGPNSLWPANDAITMQEINNRDGTSNTLLFAEAATAVPWSKPADVAIFPNVPLSLPTPVRGEGGCWFQVCFVDGHVQVWSDRVTEEMVRSLIDPRDGKHFQLPD